MARHRNVRGYNYDEDFEDDDLYGQSVEDDFCISPSTAAQFIYSKRDKPSVSAETLEEYDDEDSEHSNFMSCSKLTGMEKAQLNSCLDHMKEVLGESVPEKMLVEAVLRSKFDIQQALDSILEQENKQNMKTKKEDNVILGKASKGLFCSDIFSDINNLSNLVENMSNSTGSSFSHNGPTVNTGSSCNTSIPYENILFRSKLLKTPIKNKTLKSSCKSLETLPLSFSDSKEQFNEHKSIPLAASACNASRGPCLECDACFNSAAELLKEETKSSWSEFKEVQDLKDMLMLNETGDSSEAHDSSWITLPKKYDHGPKSCLDSCFGNLRLDNTISHKHNKKTDFFGNKSQGFFQEHNNSSLVASSSTFSMSESPSLADLLQEHQGNSSEKASSLHNLCILQSAGFTDMELGHSPLSQLASQPPVSSGMTELSGSLSSLTCSKSSPVKDLESLSLSDLIANSIEVDMPEIINSHSKLHLAKMVQPSSVNSDIDLSVLIRKSVFSPKPVELQLNTMLPETEALVSKQGQQMFITNGSKKSQKAMRTPIFKSTISWTKALSSRPSAFAITLCLRYPSKRCKHRSVNIYKAFLYSRQKEEEKINEIEPLLAITPFDFKSPSPDDIVKSGQKKAFTR